MEEIKIYTIMTCTTIEEDKVYKGFPNLGDTRIIGFYIDKDLAIKAVEENWANMNEFCFNYAIIEEVQEGLFQPSISENRMIFKFDYGNNVYKQIEEPTILNYISGITMG
jgi:hypothetical protein